MVHQSLYRRTPHEAPSGIELFINKPHLLQLHNTSQGQPVSFIGLVMVMWRQLMLCLCLHVTLIIALKQGMVMCG